MASDHEDRIRWLEDNSGGGGGGGGSTWLSGAGAPSGGLGVDGDYYLDTSNGDVYAKASGSWSVVDNLTGPAGATGATGASGTGWTRTTATVTTASLAVNAVETGTLTLAAAYRLIALTVTRACRVRLYTTSGKRSTDAARAVGTDPTPGTDHGLMFEYVATGSFTSLDLSPLVDGYCPSGTTVYYSIENRSTSTGTVGVTFDWVRTE